MGKCFYCSKKVGKLEKCQKCKKDIHANCQKKYSSNGQCCDSQFQKINKNIENYCHRCLSRERNEKLINCSSDSCRKSFCLRCIKLRYKTDSDCITSD